MLGSIFLPPFDPPQPKTLLSVRVRCLYRSMTLYAADKLILLCSEDLGQIRIDSIGHAHCYAKQAETRLPELQVRSLTSFESG